MSKTLFALLALLAMLYSCKEEDKKDKEYAGFKSIPRETALKMIAAYSDSQVNHDYQNIIKAISLNAKQISQLASKADSIKLFTAADPVNFTPTIVVQTIKRNSPVSYGYFLVLDIGATLCPPPYDCLVEVAD